MKMAALGDEPPFSAGVLNRVDEMIVFHALREEHLMQIVEIQLERAGPAGEPAHQAEDDHAARRNLVRTGFDPHYGARPLKRAVQKKVETPLGRLILKGEVRGAATCGGRGCGG